MRAPILFYVSHYQPGQRTRPVAVPVHLVDDRDTWPTVRALAGRRAGETFVIVRDDLHYTVGSARLVPGGREAIEKYGIRPLSQANAARALRRHIGRHDAWSWSSRQLRNAFERVMEVATPVRQKTENDRAWAYFDRDIVRWREGERSGARLVTMLDMVLGAAERYRAPDVDPRSPLYVRATVLERQANGLSIAIDAPAFEEPTRWLEVADAYEVAEDAWREAGDEDRAENVAAKRQNILTTIKLAYAPRRRPR